MTRQPGYEAEGAVVVDTLATAFEEAGGAEEVMIAGGEGVYGAALPLADRLYLTHVDTEVEEGDTRFPEVDLSDFKVVEEKSFPADEEHEHAFRIVVYQRARKRR
jgi:dihydrofolate reductase